MWEIELSSAVKKQAKKLPNKAKDSLKVLLREIQEKGPIRKNWPNFSPLSKRKGRIPPNAYHCHIKKGKPTYVVCWRKENNKIRIIEVFYVGTHENAPY